MNIFPNLSCSPDIQGFADEHLEHIVEVGNRASGYPIPIKKFTFDPRTWSCTFSNVSQADKETLLAFYQDNMEVPFYWLNEQEDTVYEVVFGGRPSCRVQDNDNKELWQIGMTLIQSSPMEYDGSYISRRYYGANAMIVIENLAPGADISLRAAYVATEGQSIYRVDFTTQGTPSGIDNSNPVTITLTNEDGDTVWTKTYNTATQPPTNDSEDVSAGLDSSYAELDAGDVLYLTVTQGTTANMPAGFITLGVYLR